MMRFLHGLSEKCQVFITTHSTNFLDRGGYQNIYLISKQEYTTVDQLDFREVEEKIPQELGVRLSSLFMYDRLVFVEGPSDELIIRELSNLLSVNLSQKNVGFIPLNGTRNLSYYATKEILDFLTKRRVRMWFVLDRDEKSDDDVKAISARLGSNVIFFATEGRELENYLLNPTANRNYLLARKGSREDVQQLTDGDVAAKLNLCADTLKSYAIWKRVAAQVYPFNPIRDRKAVDIANSSAQELVRKDIEAAIEGLKLTSTDIDERAQVIKNDIEMRWNQEKLKIAPGALVLDEFYKL